MEALSVPGGQQGESPADDRLHRSRGDRAGPHLLPGKGDHQLDQPGGGRGALRSRSSPWPSGSGPPWWSARIDEDKRKGWPSPGSASWRSPGAPTIFWSTSTACRPQDIIFDPLVFPCATGDQQYLGSARETIEGIRLIKEALPQCKTILGISNVSFGLPPAGREVLNSVFLYHCTQAGLDMAIVNSEKLERYAAHPRGGEGAGRSGPLRDQRRGHRRLRRALPRLEPGAEGARELSLDERLASYIIEGSKDGLIEDLELKLKEASPLEIINGPLMAAWTKWAASSTTTSSSSPRCCKAPRR